MKSKISIKKNKRSFVSDDLEINEWKDVETYYQNLLDRTISSLDELLKWLKDRSELDSVVSEDYRWRYIKQSVDTENETYKNSFLDFTQQISPQLQKIGNDLDKKLYESPYFDLLEDARFFVFKRNLKNSLELYREENIPINMELQIKAREYGAIVGAMTIQHEEKELTLQQTAVLLERKDRSLREQVFNKVGERRLQDKDKINTLFDELINNRHQLALNAGFENYRDYKLQAMGRFDYGVTECEQFHDAISQVVVPVVKEIQNQRKEALQFESLKPYDLSVDYRGEELPKPFENNEEFVAKTIANLSAIDSFFGETLSTLNKLGHLDLMSRKGKAPGGYNMPLPEIGIPFIFMNAVGSIKDIRVLVHESGHAVHSVLSKDLEFYADKELTSEIAELASMSMELFALDDYDVFYEDAPLKKRAILEYLDNTISMIPWIALIDKFQHWIYTNIGHSVKEREDKWVELHEQFSTEVIDWSGYEEERANLWQKQLHLFQVPFYYIEYGIAQLGAVALWRNFKSDKREAIHQYQEALKLGYTKPITDVYNTAGIKFDFSKKYIAELMDFVKEEIAKINL